MNNIKKVLSHLLALGLFACGTFSVALMNRRDAKQASAETVVPTTQEGIYDEDHIPGDFSQEVELDYDELDVAISQSNLTDTSQAINLNFRARTSVGFATAKNNYVVTITDNTFNYKSGTKGDDDKEVYTKDHTEFDQYGIPIFRGNIFLIYGGSASSTTDAKRDVYLPSTLKSLHDVYVTDEETGEQIKTGDAKKGDFIVEIDSIAAHAVIDGYKHYTAEEIEEKSLVEGTDYEVDALGNYVQIKIKSGKAEPVADTSKKNRWAKISNIYIPSTIENVDSEAFCTGYPDKVNTVIHYEGNEIPSTFVEGWTNLPENTEEKKHFDLDPESYIKGNDKDTLDALRTVNVSLPVTGLEPSENYILGSRAEGDNSDPKYNKPLVVQFDIVNETANTRKTMYEVLPLINENDKPFDSVGEVSSRTYSRQLGYKLAKNEEIDDQSIVLHNLIKCNDKAEFDPADPEAKIYFAKPRINYSYKQKLSNLVSFKASANSTFAGFSLFTLTMNKVNVPANEEYNFEHSLYLDVMSGQYKQHEENIKAGLTHIRYSLYNLYKSSYYFEYVGKDGSIKNVTVPIKSTITYQVLEHMKGNKVGVLVQNSSVAPDFAPEKVRKFELKDITIQMDLQGTSSAGTVVSLGNKSSISYRFAYLTVFDNQKNLSVFSWNLFLVIFVLGYMALYAAGSFILFKVMKEKFKNDEFRRVNNKKFLKTAILGGLGSTVVVLSILFIVMRTVGFRNTIVVFNPVDPLLIVFTIAALIITGYFIVHMVKLIKAEKERRRAIRLRLNEDVDDDGTN